MIAGGGKRPAQMRAFNTRFCMIIPFIAMLVYALILLDAFSASWFASIYYGEVFRGRYVQQHMDIPITRRIKD